jgi:hypothetical protein
LICRKVYGWFNLFICFSGQWIFTSKTVYDFKLLGADDLSIVGELGPAFRCNLLRLSLWSAAGGFPLQSGLATV